MQLHLQQTFFTLSRYTTTTAGNSLPEVMLAVLAIRGLLAQILVNGFTMFFFFLSNFVNSELLFNVKVITLLVIKK